MIDSKDPTLDLHVRLDPGLARRLRAFAAGSERTLGGSVRLLLRQGLSRVEQPDRAPVARGGEVKRPAS